MANNPYVNKVELADGTPIIDISSDTVSSASLMEGYTAHDASGAPIVGTARGGADDGYVWQDGQGYVHLSDNQGTDFVANIIADPYDSTATYDVGDYCAYNGLFYRCNTAISVAEAWNASHWTQLTVVEAMPDVSGKADKVSGATSGNFAALDSTGNLTDSGHKHSDYLTSHQDITGKADKVSNATNGNFASLNASGNLVDSGHKHSDYLTSHQDISGKADKVSNATSGHFASLDANGNLVDSGHQHSDYATASALNGKISEPTSEGSNGQVLTTDGNGGRTWSTIRSGGGSVALLELDQTIATTDWVLTNGSYVATLTNADITANMTGVDYWLATPDPLIDSAVFTTSAGTLTITLPSCPSSAWILHLLLGENGSEVLDDISDVQADVTAVKNNIAYVETGSTSTNAIEKWQYVIWQGVLYTASDAIAVGDTLSTSTNLIAVPNGGLNDINYRVNTKAYYNDFEADASNTTWAWGSTVLICNDYAAMLSTGVTTKSSSSDYYTIGTITNNAHRPSSEIRGICVCQDDNSVRLVRVLSTGEIAIYKPSGSRTYWFNLTWMMVKS